MRKQLIGSVSEDLPDSPETWLNVEDIATAEISSTQEFSLRWSPKRTNQLQDIVRQRWNFSPEGSTVEIEDYKVNLPGVMVLELSIQPDLDRNIAVASIQEWRLP